MQSNTSSPSKNQDINLLDLLGALWRGKTLIITTVILFAALSLYYLLVLAIPKYAATSTLSLQLRNEQVVDIESVISGVSTDESAINTELEIFRSTILLKSLVEELDLTKDPEFNAALQPKPRLSLNKAVSYIKSFFDTPDIDNSEPEQSGFDDAEMIRTIAAVRDSISVANLRYSYVFRVRATSEDSIKAALISNTLAKLYIQDQIDVKYQATESAVVWLSERVTELGAELDERDHELKQMRMNMSVTSQEDVGALNAQVREMRDRVSRMQADIIEQRTRELELATLVENTRFAEISRQFTDVALSRLASQAEAGDVEAQRLFLKRANLLIDSIKAETERLVTQKAALLLSVDRTSADIESQSNQLISFQKYERDTKTTRTLYETFLTRLKETSVQRGVQQADSRLLTPAIPGSYVEPSKSRILILSIILGFILGSIFVLFKQYIHTGFRTIEDLEAATGSLVVGQFPKMPIRRRGELGAYLDENPTSASSEMVRNIRTSILMSNIDKPPQVIMVTSSLPGEGKTTNAIALAHSFSGLNKRVLILECDIRRRTFTEYFSAPPSGLGLIAALQPDVDLTEIIFTEPSLGIDVLIGDKIQTNAADVFASNKFRNLITRLRTQYDYIIIDTPPVLVVPDARVIGHQADSLLMVVKWNSTQAAQVRETLRQIANANLKVSGLILSQIDAAGMKRYGYDGKYGYYGGKGAGYYDT